MHDLPATGAVIYRGMARAALDAAYDNMRAVPAATEVLADFQGRANKIYVRDGWRRDLKYGAGERQRYDALVQDPDLPTFVFLHGGYWQRCTKEDFAFIARGPLSAGYNVILVEYTLAPPVTIPGIVGEIGMLLDHLACDTEKLGLTGAPLVLSGHSAGGHLAAMWRSHPRVDIVMPISGLFELEPIRLCYLNEDLHLTPEAAAATSPGSAIADGAPMLVVVGGGELPELIRQSVDYVEALRQSGQTAHYLNVAGQDHFRVLEDLVRPDGLMFTALNGMVANLPSFRRGS